MAVELGGMLIGGTILAATSYIASKSLSFNENLADEKCLASRKTAINNYNINYDSPESGCLVLSPRFGNSYVNLQEAMKSIGVPVLMNNEEQFATLDLSKILNENLKSPYEEERRLFTEMVRCGLLLSPGETYNLEKPGLFRIYCPILTDNIVLTIQDRLSTAIENYKSSTLFSPSINTTGNVSTEELNDSFSTSNKKRKKN